GQRQRRRRARAHQQEQDLLEPAPRRHLALGAHEKLHGREAHGPHPPLADAVNQPRQHRGQEAAQQRRGEEAPAGPAPAYRRTRWRPNRNARSTSAGGSAVLAKRYSTRDSRQLMRQRSRRASDSRRNESARSRGSTSSRRASSGSM